MNKTIIFALIATVSQLAVAQQKTLPAPKGFDNSRVITTGVPFLQIVADARSAGIGDMGVASSMDVFSQQHNPAKYAFSTERHGIATSFTPYMASVVNDVSLGQINYFTKFDERSAVAVSLRYFGLGKIEFRQDYNSPAVVRSPNEFALDASYSLKLHENFAMSVAGRFISSNLKTPEESGSGNAAAAKTFSFDVSGFYESEKIAFGDFEGRWRAGFNFQNIGPKISYDDSDIHANFIPSNLKLGAGFDFVLDQYNVIAVYGEVNKLLVPTPQTPVFIDSNNNGKVDDNEARDAIAKTKKAYNDIGWFSGVFRSFGDAPGGFKEEMQEFTLGLGAEYWYDNSFAFRMGYFNESKFKGYRKYATLGAGFKYNTITVDMSYLFSVSKVKNPLENSLRFSLTFNFGEKYTKF